MEAFVAHLPDRKGLLICEVGDVALELADPLEAKNPNENGVQADD